MHVKIPYRMQFNILQRKFLSAGRKFERAENSQKERGESEENCFRTSSKLEEKVIILYLQSDSTLERRWLGFLAVSRKSVQHCQFEFSHNCQEFFSPLIKSTRRVSYQRLFRDRAKKISTSF